jgi:predicted nuclease with TOPRIM domain
MSDLIKRLKDAVLPIQSVWPLRLEAANRITELEAEAERSQEAYRVIWDERTQLGKRCAELQAKLDSVRGLADELENVDDETIPVNALFAWRLAGNKLRAALGDEDE